MVEKLFDLVARPARPLILKSFFSNDWKKIIHEAGIIVFGFFLIFLLILLKSKTTVDFHIEPYVFSYGIFVTTFILSRIISSMFYKSSFESLLKSVKSRNLFEPPISFIIPCKNEENNISESVARCFEINHPKDKLEVIVINDGSTDGTLEKLNQLSSRYLNLKVLSWEKNRGKRHAMAEGFKIAKGEVLIQLDSDSFLDSQTFSKFIEPFRNKKVGAVCASGQPQNASQNLLTKMQASYYFMSFNILKSAESTYDTVFCCSGCCSAYRKSAVMPIIDKWVNEKFLGRPATWGDDRALTSWLLKTDWKTVFNLEAKAFTIVPFSLKHLLTQQLRWKKSWIVNVFFTLHFIFKKQPFVSFFYYLPLAVISFLTPLMTFLPLSIIRLLSTIFPFIIWLE